MNKLRFVLLFCAISSFILLNYQEITACTCLDSGSIKAHYSGADAVIIGKVEKIETATLQSYGSELVGQKVRIKIEKQFKGNISEYITLAQPNTSCDWQFKDDDKSKSFLFYLDFNEKTKDYTIKICGRSGEIKDRSNDLSWLNGLPKSLERTRFSGVFEHYEENPRFTFIEYLPGVRIKIFNDKNTFEVISDKSGMYEIWDLPAGKYKVKPELPETFKVYLEMVSGTVEYKFFENGKEDLKNYTIEVPPKGCAGIDYIVNKIK